jgi:hypothetical protein
VAPGTKNKGKFSVKAYAGDAKTLLAFNLDKPSAKNLAGFAVQCQPHGQTAYYIQNELQFKSPGFTDLTEKEALPALDFRRSHILDDTGPWRDSDVMDGSEEPEPVASLKRLLSKAHSSGAGLYILGRTYTDGSPGIHDVHMNQGSSGSFVNNGRDDHNDHNDIWQDGAVVVDLGQPECAAYFTAFTQQVVPTDNLGNPEPGSHQIQDSDAGLLGGN